MIGRTISHYQILEKLGAGGMATQFPTDTLMQAVTVPAIRAAIELRAGNPTAALDHLRAPKPYEPVDLVISYLRGLAYLQAKLPAEAVAEFPGHC